MVRGSAPLADGRGATLVELLALLGVIGVVILVAVPVLTRAADAADAAAAARYIATVLARTRLDAAREHRVLAVRFAKATPVAPVTAASPAPAANGGGGGGGRRRRGRR